MGIIEDVFGNLPDPPRQGTAVVAHDHPATTGEQGPARPDFTFTRQTFMDQVEAGMTFISPHPCHGGREGCGLPATTHTRGKYHECAVIDRRVEGPVVVLIYLDEDGIQQSVGPVPGLLPVRIRLTLGERTAGDPPGD